MKKEIKISEVLSLLENGYTRYEKDAEETGKSIEAHYELPATKIADIFKHPKLKFKKTDHNAFELIDDTDDEGIIAETTQTQEADSDIINAVNSIFN